MYCGGSEKSNHYPDCITKDVGEIIKKYNVPIPEVKKVKTKKADAVDK